MNEILKTVLCIVLNLHTPHRRNMVCNGVAFTSFCKRCHKDITMDRRGRWK